MSHFFFFHVCVLFCIVFEQQQKKKFHDPLRRYCEELGHFICIDSVCGCSRSQRQPSNTEKSNRSVASGNLWIDRFHKIIFLFNFFIYLFGFVIFCVVCSVEIKWFVAKSQTADCTILRFNCSFVVVVYRMMDSWSLFIYVVVMWFLWCTEMLRLCDFVHLWACLLFSISLDCAMAICLI